ncbi:LysM domain-containing protein [Mesorhizobium sp. BR1-1-16]|uniref:LysM peptidoglycan-binding domain-containing protein n=1 Tax=Mesorhizobium sp. BR1-1-16 TaxID=2876653 RepID=UPI001CCC2BD2|nr:LysM domain-containing protein [Mesorhizobium sp. BR1-1-16]MBZ9935671.1 LysM domain-containing protein [Mesorhizobium sp. BR1-1-16]
MRTFIVKSGQTLADIRAELIDGRVSKAQNEATLKRIRDLNPELSAGRIKPGTVVLVPDAPGIKPAATKPAKSDPASMLNSQFEAAIKDTLRQVAADLRSREAERAELAEAFTSDAFKRALKSDQELGGKAELANKAIAEDAAADKALEGALTNMHEAARASIEKLDKLLG